MSSTWYITRKFPPDVGGMQWLSAHIARELGRMGQLRLVKWGRDNTWLAAFAAISTTRLLLGLARRDVRVLLLGDPVLSWLGLIAKRAGRPVAVVVHGLDVTYDRAIYQTYLRYCFWRRFDAYICISRHVAELVAARGVPPERIHLIHPGVELVPEQACQTGDGVRLLFLGRLVARKGAHWFLANVFPALKSRFPELHLDIVGGGPEAAELHDCALQFESGVTLHGAIDDAAKRALLQASSALIAPNLPTPGDPEGFGLVALEASAAGRYVFAANLEGLRDAVADPSTGRLLPAGDANAWVEALSAACASSTELAALGQQARQYVVEHDLSWQAMGRRYLQVLDALA